jgi:subtilisin family serine protease
VASTSAPSSYARTTLPGASAGLYGFGSGTSYAAPEVAGAAALVWAANPTLTADQVASTLEQTASGGGAWTPGLGYGVLDVARAVASATGAPMPPLAPKTVAMPMPKQKAKAKPLRTKRR